MTTISSKITINKPIEEVFTYMASPHNGHAFVPNLNENTNIVPEQDAVGQKFDWLFNMAGVDLRGKAEVTEYIFPIKVVISSTGDTASIWTYELKALGDETTEVIVQIDYELSETSLQRIANKIVINKIAHNTTHQMLDNLKTILEA